MKLLTSSHPSKFRAYYNHFKYTASNTMKLRGSPLIFRTILEGRGLDWQMNAILPQARPKCHVIYPNEKVIRTHQFGTVASAFLALTLSIHSLLLPTCPSALAVTRRSISLKKSPSWGKIDTSHALRVKNAARPWPLVTTQSILLLLLLDNIVLTQRVCRGGAESHMFKWISELEGWDCYVDPGSLTGILPTMHSSPP